MTGSYVSNDFSVNVKNELDRLSNQVDLFWEKESIHYHNLSFGSGNGKRILECGSGSGHYMTKLVNLFPEAEFYSLEADPEYAKVQKELFSQPPYDKISVTNSIIEDANFPSGHFDLIILRLVLEHLPNVSEVLAQLRDLLNIGGRLIIVSNDFHNHLLTYPHIAELDDLYEAYCKLRVDQGGNPYIGREMPVMFENAGFSNIDLDTITAHSTLTGDAKFLSSESSAIGLTLVEKEYIDIKIYEALSKKWSEVLLNDNHAYTRSLYICSGVKATEKPEIKQNLSSTGAKKVAQPAKATISKDGDILSMLEEKWKEILERDQIDIDQNIFDLGGTSLFVLHIKNFVKEELGMEYPTSFFFQYPTIRHLSDAISQPATESSNTSGDTPSNNLQQLKDRFKKK